MMMYQEFLISQKAVNLFEKISAVYMTVLSIVQRCASSLEMLKGIGCTCVRS
jgi:hypothetical protein